MEILQHIYRWVWGIPTLMLILLVGLYLGFKTRFCQLRLLPRSLKFFFSRVSSKQQPQAGTSSFQALCTALAATVGTGNLAGVAGAIALGGPGSVFWMWLCAILGMGLKFAEATLAIRYRAKNTAGEVVGGPMYMIKAALPKTLWPMASVYAFFGVVAALGVGNATQIGTVVAALSDTAAAFGVSVTFGTKLLLGLLLAALIGAILLGGARRIGRGAELLVPFAAGLYMLLCVVVLIARWQKIPSAFGMILEGAFSPQAVTGGMIGSALIALRTGVSRGIFTNEAGMGTASIAHASAAVDHPVQQGMMGIVEVFLDTMVICTLTALVILVSGVPISYGVDLGVQLTVAAFSTVLGSWVSVIITLSLCLFALATVLGWGLYGLRCAQFLFGDRVWRIFSCLQILMVVVGALLRADVIWLIAEIVNGLMAIPNLIVIGVLTPQLIAIYKNYLLGGTYENFHQCQSL